MIDVRHPLGVLASTSWTARRTGIAVAGAALCTAAVIAAGSAAPTDQAFGRSLLQLLIVGLPIAAGLYALGSTAHAGFGAGLLAVGFCWSLTALGESSASVPYTVGRLATWLVFPAAYYLLVAFPDGRVERGLDRFLVVAVSLIALFLFFGTAPLVDDYPAKTLWATCTTDCPPNALQLVDRPPAWLPELITVREWLVIAVWLATFASLVRRWRRASPMQHRTLGPVFAIATLWGLSHIAFHLTRQAGAPTDTVVLLSSVWTFCIVALCCAILLGLVRHRIELASTLTRLGAALRRTDDPSRARDALADALSDSTIQLLLHDRRAGCWRDPDGRPATWPVQPAPGRAATPVTAPHGEVDAVLLHDAALTDDAELLEGVTGVLLAGWRQEQLLDDLAGAMAELEDSRRRIAEAADLERARIERDLHDGAQQRLIALRIRLGLAEELLEEDTAAGIRAMRDIGFEADRALEELRSLAHGVYPSLLADRGLADAVRAVARQAPIPIDVLADGMSRHPIEIETAVYFTCAEALQNVVKHAPEATALRVRLRDSPDRLSFEVCDDGPGFDPGGARGRGLRNMHDRIEAVGGRLRIESAPGSGTRVVGEVPLTHP
jgi:signal transduction histidine kinase